MRKHTGDQQRYECRICGLRFSRSDGLLLHQRRHAGLKTYSCAQCGAKFVDSSELSKHISVHMRDIQEKNDFGEEKDL
nr:hypothetical protein BaRGS_018385 [Batillaria attramentaria]